MFTLFLQLENMREKTFALFLRQIQFVSCTFTEPPKHNASESNVKRMLKMKEDGLRTVYFLNMVLSSDNHIYIFRLHDLGSIPGLGKSPGKGSGNPLQCSCLVNSVNRGAWRGTVHRVTKSQTQLTIFHFSLCLCLLICPL